MTEVEEASSIPAVATLVFREIPPSMDPFFREFALAADTIFELSAAAREAVFVELAAHPTADVSPQKGKGWKKCCGTHVNAKGEVRPKVFYLGHDRPLAGRLAALIVAIHRGLRIEGQQHWTPHNLALVELAKEMTGQWWSDQLRGVRRHWAALGQTGIPEAATGSMASAPPVPLPAPALAPAAAKTRSLHASMDAWVDHLDNRHRADDLSGDYASRARSTVRNLKLAIADRPLDGLDVAELDTGRLWYQRALATPKGQPGAKAWDTAKTELSQARAMFNWFAEKGWWTEPARWRKALTPAMTAQADDEREDRDDVPEVFTITELAKLYAAGNDNQRLALLCGLNFAWGQKEMATCRKRHWEALADGRVMVKRRRNKRARNARPVYAEWYAWPETWALAKPRMDCTPDDPTVNPKGLAFLTEDGLPLVRRKPYKADAVRQSFSRLCKAAKVEDRGFYALRRTAIDMVEDIAGETVAQMMGSHRPRSITGRHYARRKWHKLHRAMRIMRKRLRAVFAVETEVSH
jgi:integrase